MPSPLAASSAWSGAEIFSFATGVNLAALGGHLGARAAQGKKPHQGIFSNNPALRVGEIWAKWPGTHQDSETWWRNTASGSALDANGSTLTDAQGRNFTWDFQNRLTQVVNPGVGTTSFRYDPFGRRIQKSGPLGTTNYLYDGNNLLEELDTVSNVLARYTNGADIDEPLSELRTTTSYYQQDALSSVSSLSNGAGALANTYTYDGFGKLTASTGTVTNPFQYTGREIDAESGIYEYRARYYDTTIGRFVSEDPLRFAAGNNFFNYAKNTPTVYRDPSGLAAAASPVLSPKPVVSLEPWAILGLAYYDWQLFSLEYAMLQEWQQRERPDLGPAFGQCKKKDNNSCEDQRTQCLATSMAGLPGHLWGHNRCMECYEGCVRNGGTWPSSVARTKGKVRCDYWNF